MNDVNDPMSHEQRCVFSLNGKVEILSLTAESADLLSIKCNRCPLKLMRKKRIGKRKLRNEFAEINFSLKLVQFQFQFNGGFHSQPWDEHTSYSQYLNLLTKCANKRNIISIPRLSHYYLCVCVCIWKAKSLLLARSHSNNFDPLLVYLKSILWNNSHHSFVRWLKLTLCKWYGSGC